MTRRTDSAYSLEDPIAEVPIAEILNDCRSFWMSDDGPVGCAPDEWKRPSHGEASAWQNGLEHMANPIERLSIDQPRVQRTPHQSGPRAFLNLRTIGVRLRRGVMLGGRL